MVNQCSKADDVVGACVVSVCLAAGVLVDFVGETAGVVYTLVAFNVVEGVEVVICEVLKLISNQ